MGIDVDRGLKAMNDLNATIDMITSSEPPQDPKAITKAFVAMVGPPARGKSASFNIICDRFASSNITMINAGSLRRKWEADIKAYDDAYFRQIMFNAIGHAVPEAEDIVNKLTLWKNQPTTSAIPGDLFKHLQVLNNIFAKVCWETGMDMLNNGVVDICVFDATNTDCDRRSQLLQSFRQKHMDSTDFVFVENLCSNKRQLFRNFASKLKASSDYNKYFTDATHEEIQELVKLYTQSESCIEDIFNIDVEALEGLQERFVFHMRDIITRDITSYQMKYKPLNAACNRDSPDSTIDGMTGTNEYYVQIINKVCVPDETSPSTIINSNVQDADLLERFRNYVVGSDGANYEDEKRYVFTDADFDKVMTTLDVLPTVRRSAADSGMVGGGTSTHAFILPSILALCTILSSIVPR
jgi:hypothetical protein